MNEKAAILDLLRTAPEPYHVGEICNILLMYDGVEISEDTAAIILHELLAEGKVLKAGLSSRDFWIIAERG